MVRAPTKSAAGRIAGDETFGGFSGKGPVLAEGLLYSGDPAKYKKDLAETAALTPARIRDVAVRWLGRPALRRTARGHARNADDPRRRHALGGPRHELFPQAR